LAIDFIQLRRYFFRPAFSYLDIFASYCNLANKGLSINFQDEVAENLSRKPLIKFQIF